MRPGAPADVADLRGTSLEAAQGHVTTDSTDVSPARRGLRQHSTVCIGKGDFKLTATIEFDEPTGRGAGIAFDGGSVVLDDPEWGAVLTGRLFGGGKFPLENSRPSTARPGAPVSIEIARANGVLAVRINDVEMGTIGVKDIAIGRVGFDLGGGVMRVQACSVEGDHSLQPRPIALFTSADGDIDEFRDPTVASDGKRVLVGAIAVSTAADGSSKSELHVRGINVDAVPSVVDLGGVQPDLALLGWRADSTGGAWMLIVQAPSPQRLVEKLDVFESSDGAHFQKVAEVDSSGAPLQLVTGAIRSTAEGNPVAFATRISNREPHACAIERGRDGKWTARDIGAGVGANVGANIAANIGCEPVWLNASNTLIRTPRSTERSVLHDGALTVASKYEGGALAGTALLAPNGTLSIAQPEGALPNPMRELTSTDLGASWSVARVLWGGAAGSSCSTTLDGQTLLVFEGGDKARRQHVLMLKVPLRAETTAPPVKQTDGAVDVRKQDVQKKAG